MLYNQPHYYKIVAMDNKNIEKKRNLMVVKDTEFIQKVSYNLTTNEQKLVIYCIASITPNDKTLHWINIKVSDFCEVCGIDKNHFYSDFKSLIKNLDSKTYWIETEEKDFLFRWFSEAEYIKSTGTVRLLLNSNLSQYLIRLQTKYTKYELYNILALKSRYSIRLYEIFKSYKYANKKQAIIELNLEDLKKQIGATNKSLDNFAELKRKVIDKAVNEINEFTDIKVSYEIGEKYRKKVISLVFTISEKSIYDTAFSLHRTLNRLDKPEAGNEDEL